MNKHEKEKLSKYGKLVWDFVNSKNTDHILMSFFENLQAAFNFSKDFPEKALTFYPTIQMAIGTLSNKEYDLFKLLLKRDKILLARKNYPFYQKSCTDKYGSSLSRSSAGELILPAGSTHIRLIPIPGIGEYIEHEITNDYEHDLNANIKELTKLSHQIEEIKPQSTKRFAEIEKRAKDYRKILKLHDYLKEIQKNLKAILLQIIESENAYESEGFDNILRQYNRMHKRMLIVENDDSLREISAFIEKDFYKDLSVQTLAHYKNTFNDTNIYCLIEYLKNLEYSGKERITVCRNCNCIFGKLRLDNHQIYCPVCSRKNKMISEQRAVNMKDYRANWAGTKFAAKKKREAALKTYDQYKVNQKRG